MKKIIWVTWIFLALAIAGYLSFNMFISDDKSQFLIGEATHGHHQIEMACETCHTDAFGGGEVLQNACLNCHKDELKESQDSHPAKKFRDPSNAALLDIIDARQCVSCHTEHQKEQTHEMGLTIPKDYCYHCHTEVLEERESHKDLPFDSCASAGCHNYHDNRALYENFLVKHSNQHWLKEDGQIAEADYAHWFAPKTKSKKVFTEKINANPQIMAEHSANAHGQAGLTCAACHGQEDEWLEKPTLAQCSTCHENEAAGFVEGKHGMRQSEKLSKTLSPLTAEHAAPGLKFHEDAMHIEHGCNTCHSAHAFNTQEAAVDSCLTCHADEHSMSFESSPHAQNELTCASCHMPRTEMKKNGKTVVSVEHNQNANLRPNEKMIRPVCMQCHSLEFSIDALADKKLIRNNFNGKPEVHIESMDWALDRQ